MKQLFVSFPFYYQQLFSSFQDVGTNSIASAESLEIGVLFMFIFS